MSRFPFLPCRLQTLALPDPYARFHDACAAPIETVILSGSAYATLTRPALAHLFSPQMQIIR